MALRRAIFERSLKAARTLRQFRNSQLIRKTTDCQTNPKAARCGISP